MKTESIEQSKYKSLTEASREAAENAYCPYSSFYVGAAILTESGKIFTGCNVENSSYGASICAERTAAVKAVSAGERSFAAVAVYGRGENGEYPFCMPCGICRQFLAEFGKGSIEIVVSDTKNIKIYTLKELLPEAFSL